MQSLMRFNRIGQEQGECPICIRSQMFNSAIKAAKSLKNDAIDGPVFKENLGSD